MSSTTIKVSRALRDRLALRAAELETTLAGVIERALEESEEHRFWVSVRAEHAALTAEERAEYLPMADMDHLRNPIDDEVSKSGGW